MPSELEAPPSYAQATGSSTASNRTGGNNLLQVPQAQNGIPAAARRSMEDEQRALPAGWVRQWDDREQHQFFVDTKSTPPRSIWHHPYDDDDYLATLSSEERERIQETERKRRVRFSEDLTDDEKKNPRPSSPSKSTARPAMEQRHSTAGSLGGESSTASTKDRESKFGRRLKNKLTGTTHEEREQDRARREQEEREYYERHMQFRRALQQAQMTGQPQFLAKDKDGHDVFIEPPQYSGGYGGGMGMTMGRGSYGYNPYSSGPYANPNARFIRPNMPYGRPYGSGYGGGLGMPVAGGLLGGMLLGGLLF